MTRTTQLIVYFASISVALAIVGTVVLAQDSAPVVSPIEIRTEPGPEPGDLVPVVGTNGKPVVCPDGEKLLVEIPGPPTAGTELLPASPAASENPKRLEAEPAEDVATVPRCGPEGGGPGAEPVMVPITAAEGANTGSSGPLRSAPLTLPMARWLSAVALGGIVVLVLVLSTGGRPSNQARTTVTRQAGPSPLPATPAIIRDCEALVETATTENTRLFICRALLEEVAGTRRRSCRSDRLRRHRPERDKLTARSSGDDDRGDPPDAAARRREPRRTASQPVKIAIRSRRRPARRR